MNDRGNGVHRGHTVDGRVGDTELGGTVAPAGTQSEGIQKAGGSSRVILGGENGQPSVGSVFVLVGIGTGLAGRRRRVELHVVRLGHDGGGCVGKQVAVLVAAVLDVELQWY